MTPVAILAAALGVAAAMLVVHALYRGARRQIVVASLKPFEPESRPRLTLASLTERALLAARLALIAVLAAIAIHERPDPAPAAAGGDVVAVVPGTAPPPNAAGERVVWLDGRQTPVDAAPQRGDVTAGALLALAQALDDDARLVVAGALPATDWPAASPRFGRDIEWRGDSRRPSMADDWVVAGAPARIVVTGDDAVLSAAVTSALSLWRDAGLLPEDLPVEVGGSTAGAAVIALGGGAESASDWYASVVHVQRPHGAGVVYEPTATRGAFATALWHALTARAGRQPAPGTVVAPEPVPEAREALVRGNARRRVGTPVAPAWLLLGVALFAIERWLAARGAAR